MKGKTSKLVSKKLSLAIALALSPVIVSGQLFNAVEELASLNGNNGFRIDGAADGDSSGFSVNTAGDFNGDGISDLIIGSPQRFFSDNPDNNGSGRTHIVFGKNGGFNSSINLSELDGSNGFELISDTEQEKSGTSVSGIGDFNGDGIDDVLIGAPSKRTQVLVPGSPPTLIIGESGISYVVFGSTGGFSSSMNLSELDGSNGLAIIADEPGQLLGRWVSAAGDFNGDGIDDLLIGSPGFDGSVPDFDEMGATYVIFGSTAGFNSSMNLTEIDGTNGVRLVGDEVEDSAGFRVGSLGDFNGDGVDDVIIAARGVNPDILGPSIPGISYVVFGNANGLPASIALADLDGSNGFAINSIVPVNTLDGPNLGTVNGIGDINGDGLDDLIIGNRAEANHAGRSYIVFGSSGGFASSMDLSDLNGSNGFVINGASIASAFGGLFGNDAGRAGDVNGDGLDDMIVAAYNAGEAGISYVIFGSTEGFGSVMEITDLNGSNGFAMPGVRQGDRSGTSVKAAGDVNNDGISDLIIGDPGANPTNSTNAIGASYVVFGRSGVDTIFSNGFE